MIKKLFAGLIAISLSACTLPQIGIQSPAPLAKTTIDDSALTAAWKSLDAVADAVNLVLDIKPSLIGKPGTIRAANAMDALSAALTVAESAAAAGSTTDYQVALAKAKDAYTELRLALLAMKGQ
jgi:hypothetical protein